MRPSNCLNCGATITAAQKFCPACGQKTDIKRLTLGALVADFFGRIFHAEKGFWMMAKGLALNPGKTAAEYVEGRRKIYFNPFGFMAICIAAMVLLNKWLHPYNDLPKADPAVIARLPREELKWMYEETVHRLAAVQDFFNKNLNVISVIVTPYFSFFLWLFYKRRKRNIAEITVAYLLFTAFSNIAASIVFSPVLGAIRNTPAYVFVFWGTMLLQTLYFAWGFKVFFGYHTFRNFFKILLVLWLIGFVGLVIVFTSYYFYVYGGASELLPYL